MLRLGLFFLIVVGSLIFLIFYFRNRGKNRVDQLLQWLYTSPIHKYEKVELMEKMDISALDLRVVISTAKSKRLVQEQGNSVVLTEFGKKHYETFVRSKGTQ